MHDPTSDWKFRVFSLGISIIFVVEFTAFVVTQVWHVIGPLF